MGVTLAILWSAFSKKINYNKHKYVVYSNIFNINNEDLNEPKSNWKIAKEFKSWQIKVILYEKNSLQRQ